MSQRRQDARRAKQQRARDQRHSQRSAVRRAAPATTAARPAVPAAAAKGGGLFTARNRNIAIAAVVGIVVVAIAVWVFMASRAPLPGTHYDTQGNQHLSSPTDQHPPYTTDPPTSGWHLADLPKVGVYKQPRTPESLPHLMEHGAVWVLYNCPDGCADDVAQLEQIVRDANDRGRPAAIAPYPSMQSKFATVSWQWLQTYDSLDKVKVENFINRHACQYNPEGGPYCPVAKGKVASAEAGTQIPVIGTVQPFSVFGSPTTVPVGVSTSTP